MSKFWTQAAKQAQPYVPGEQVEVEIKLNTNENPYPPSPKVLEAIEQATNESLRLYPSSTMETLREAIAEAFSLKQEQVFVGNGSDEVLAFSFMAFFEKNSTIKYPSITYSFYPVYAQIFNVKVDEVPLNHDFTFNHEDFFAADGGVIFPNPNAPTSLFLPIEQIEAILKENPNKVVIVDEAYVDFATESAAPLIDEYSNLLVIQTLSKSRSLAGLRVGFALGHPDLIDGLVRMKDSFNSYPVDRIALVGAEAAIRDQAYFKSSVEKIIQTRERTIKALDALGFQTLPSQTNFIFTRHKEKSGRSLYQALREHSILVRHFNQPLTEDFLRITIGRDAEMDRLIQVLKKLLI